MLTDDQMEFFLSFRGFQPDECADPPQEFSRLVSARKWKVGSKCYRKALQRLQATGPYIDSNLGEIELQFSDLDLNDDAIECVPFENFESISGKFDTFMREKGVSKDSKQYGEEAVLFFGNAANKAFGAANLNQQILRGLCHDLGINPIPTSNTQMKQAIRSIHVNIIDFLDYRRNNRTKPLKTFTSFKRFREYTLHHRGTFKKDWAKGNEVLKLLMRSILRE